MPRPRVVSLVPSATETLLALGVAPVAVTRFCDVPAAAGIPAVGGTKNPDVDAIVALGPDLVVVNDEENRAEDAGRLAAAGLALHSMSPRSVSDVGAEVRALAERLSRPVPAPFRAGDWDAWMASVLSPRWWDAFVAVWRGPARRATWMALGPDTYGASLLDLLGVGNLMADARARYPHVDLDEVAARAPNLVVLPSEPYPFTTRHVAEVEAAMPGVPVVLVDGRDLFWWGIRTPAAAARLGDVMRR